MKGNIINHLCRKSFKNKLKNSRKVLMMIISWNSLSILKSILNQYFLKSNKIKKNSLSKGPIFSYRKKTNLKSTKFANVSSLNIMQLNHSFWVVLIQSKTINGQESLNRFTILISIAFTFLGREKHQVTPY